MFSLKSGQDEKLPQLIEGSLENSVRIGSARRIFGVSSGPRRDLAPTEIFNLSRNRVSDFLARYCIVPGCVGMAGLLALGRIVGSCLATSSRPAVVTMPTHPGIVLRRATRTNRGPEIVREWSYVNYLT